MIEDSRNTEPPISPNAGWEHMQTLLNEYLPVKGQNIPINRANHTAVMFLLSTFLFMFLQLGHYTGKTPPGTAGRNSETMVDIEFTKNANLILPQKLNRIKSKNHVRRTLTTNKKNYTLSLITPEHRLQFNPHDKIAVIDKDLIKTIDPVNDNLNTKTVTLIDSTQNLVDIQTLTEKEIKRKLLKRRSWNLFGGIGLNTTISNKQNLQPFPFAEARYNINSKFYITGGVSLYSPASTSTGGISKTVYLNDTINNIHFYNEITTINRLRYADIPISAGMNISKNISLQGGLQISVLLNKTKMQVLKPYDFQMNSLDVRMISLPATMIAPYPQQDFDVQVRKIDYRVTTGIRYTKKKASIGLMYQHGIQTIAKGTFTKNNRNRLVTLNLLFQIK